MGHRVCGVIQGGETLATFTIYLLRESIKTARDAVIDGAKEHAIEDGLSKYGQLFVFFLKTHQLPLDPVDEKFSVRDVAQYTIVFAIISQSNKPDLHLPFFAKVILKSVHARLVELGYANVMLAKVDCSKDVAIAKLKPAPIRKRRTRRSGLRRAG